MPNVRDLRAPVVVREARAGGRLRRHEQFLYYERGNPRAVVAADVYVVVGAPASPPRDSYLLWNEPKGPDFVLEVTSKSTRGTDEQRKREVYASLGVSEYFLYEPRAEYLAPPLQGFRLHEGAYRALPAVTVLSNRGVAVAAAFGFVARRELCRHSAYGHGTFPFAIR